MVFLSHLNSVSDGFDRLKAVHLLREPVHGEGNKHDHTNDLAVATASSPIITGRIVARMVVGIDGDQSDRKPSAECHSDEASNQRHQVHMAILFRDVDCGLQHQDAERNAGRIPVIQMNCFVKARAAHM